MLSTCWMMSQPKHMSWGTPPSYPPHQMELVCDGRSHNSGHSEKVLTGKWQVGPFLGTGSILISVWVVNTGAYAKANIYWALSHLRIGTLSCTVHLNKKINEKELKWLKRGMFPVWDNSEVTVKCRQRPRSPFLLFESTPKTWIIPNAPFGGKNLFYSPISKRFFWREEEKRAHCLHRLNISKLREA